MTMSFFPSSFGPGATLPACDPHPGDARVVKHDAEEGKASIARRGRDEAAEQQLAIGVEVLDQRAGPAVSVLLPRSVPSGWSTSVKTAPKPLTVAGSAAVGAGYEEQTFGDVAAHRSEQALRAEGAEDVAVRRIVEQPGQPAGGN